MKRISVAQIVLIISLIIIMGMDVYSFIERLGIQTNYVEKGYINFENQNFDANSYYPLSGQWHYASYDDTELEGYVQVPSLYNKKEAGPIATKANDYGEFSLMMTLPQSGYYALRIGYISSAYVLKINGETIFENGRVGQSYHDEIPYWKPQMITFYTPSKELELKLEVSNYHHYKRGIIRHIFIGKQQGIFNLMMRDALKTMLFVGINLGTVICVLFLSSLKIFKRSLFILSGLGISSAILQLCRGVNLIYYIIPDMSFIEIIKLQYFFMGGIQLSSILFIYYTYWSDYGNKIWQRAFSALVILDILYFIFVIATPSITVLKCSRFSLILMALNMMVGFLMLISATLLGNRRARNSMLFFLLNIIYIALDVMVMNQFHRVPFESNMGSTSILGFIICQVYMMTMIIKKEIETSEEVKDLKIAFLQSQIAPHFFFNTLNTLMGVMEESVKDAQNLLVDFSNYLRAKFALSGQLNAQAPMREEIDLVNSYIRIEKRRFGSKIEYEESVDPLAFDVKMPRLMIQPLVENAIKHGYSKGDGVGKVKLIVEIVKNAIKITVEDNGCGFLTEELEQIKNDTFYDDKKGIGLKSVYLRLKALDQDDLVIKSIPDEKTSISFKWRVK